MSKAVFCIVNIPKAERIVYRLKVAGFSNNDISVIMADKGGTRDFAHEHNTKAARGPQRLATSCTRLSAVPWDGWRELAHSPFPALAP